MHIPLLIVGLLFGLAIAWALKKDPIALTAEEEKEFNRLFTKSESTLTAVRHAVANGKVEGDVTLDDVTDLGRYLSLRYRYLESKRSRG